MTDINLIKIGRNDMMYESWCDGNLSSVVTNFALISSSKSHISVDSP